MLPTALSETGSNAFRFLGVTGGTFVLVVRGGPFTRAAGAPAGAAFALVVLRGTCDWGGWTGPAASFSDLPGPRVSLPRDCLGTGAGIIPRMALHASSA